MPSVHEQIAHARARLERAGLAAEDAWFDAEVLARHALGWDRARLVADGREDMPAATAARFDDMLARRANREPVAYITGHREFWNLDFEVTRDVLIPRPETEIIVEEVSRRWPDRATRATVVDVGTGSGCLAVALAHELPAARVLAIDISSAALQIAARNAVRHGVAPRIAFVRGNLLEPVRGPVDIIVANPPYVPDGEALPREVSDFEPALALYAGPDGLRDLEQILAAARSRLSPSGLLAVEFGLGQDRAVRALAAGSGWTAVTIVEDLQRIPRAAVLTR